jgi:iron-sulfur cluster insertion protein
MNITITPDAIDAIKEVMLTEPEGVALRIFVQGGGCSGFQYGFTLDSDKAEDDWDLGRDGVAIYVDSMSAQYLEGAEINFHDDLNGKSFVINNPGAKSTCGCGSSFSV